MTGQVYEEQARAIDGLAAELDPAPDDKAGGSALLDRFPWARPTPTVLSFPVGCQGAEMALADGQTSP